MGIGSRRFLWICLQTISWEGHLSGAISGVVLAIIYRKRGPEDDRYFDDEDEDDDDDDDDYWDKEYFDQGRL